MELYTAAMALVLIAVGVWTAREVMKHYRPVATPGRFPRMVERLGLSIDDIIDSDLAYHMPTAQRLCLLCENAEECDSWLYAGQEANEAPRFCPNAAYLHLARHPSGAIE
jgi:hypothetical protein